MLASVIHATVLAAVPGTALCSPDAAADAAGDRSDFDEGFFTANGRRSSVDVARFSYPQAVMPGTYDSNIRVNGQWKGRRRVAFRQRDGVRGAQPCVDRVLLQSLGIALGHADEQRDARGDDLQAETACADIAQLVPQARWSVDNAGLDLDLQVPQIHLQRDPRGYVDPQMWSDGITAALFGYSTNLYWSEGRHGAGASAHAAISAGINVGGWRVRHRGNATWNASAGAAYEAMDAFAQHDITRWTSTLTVGDTETTGGTFDSVAIRGVRLQSDDQMLPYSRSGYAPTVRGVAETIARVTILQRGQVLHETTVAPGAFEIDDLNPTSQAGDLLVIIHEADGRKREFVVPYSATPELIRVGQTRYALSAGETRGGMSAHSRIVQATMTHGVTDHVTSYFGAVALPDYYAAQVGAAVGTKAGAFSLDLTHAKSHGGGGLDHVGRAKRDSPQGESIAVRYNKILPTIGTNIAMGAYRYSTSGYVGVGDALALRELHHRGFDASRIDRQRSRFELSIGQSLGAAAGSLNLSVGSTTFWGTRSPVHNYSVGYSNQWRAASFTISAQRTRDVYRFGRPVNNDSVYASVSVPLGNAPRAPRVNVSGSHEERTSLQRYQVGISGTTGGDSGMHYGATLSDDTLGNHGMSANASFSTGAVDLHGGVGYTAGYKTASVGAAGSLVVHGGGVTAGRGTLNETFALVHAPGATGARLSNGARVNRDGYAVSSSLLPYRLNDVWLDPKGMPDDVQLQSTNQHVAPRSGSVVRLEFETDVQKQHLIVARRADGRSLPFGAQVLDSDGREVGVVAQSSRVLLRGLDQAAGQVRVRWGESASEQCVIVLPADAMRQVRGATATWVGRCNASANAVKGVQQ